MFRMTTAVYFLLLHSYCILLEAQVTSVLQPSAENPVLTERLADADISDPAVKSAAAYALEEVDKRSHSAYRHVLVNAKKQVVAGIQYHFQLEVGESNCDKTNTSKVSECHLREGINNQICIVKVWNRPWLNNWKVTKVQCFAKAVRQKRMAKHEELEESIVDSDVNDVDIKSTAAFALYQINNQPNLTYKQMLIQILSAKTQVVTGTLYHLKLELGDSNCSRENSGTVFWCTLRDNSNTQICNVKVWDRPWLNKREITELSCVPKPGQQ